MKKENTKEVLMGGLSFLKFEKIEKNSSKL
ncbi:Uncharacterised protein [Campylobacter jejuni subsp. doylei]|nr:Uncharacterised protein [Campylobacter jejuni subsp. doylei]